MSQKKSKKQPLTTEQRREALKEKLIQVLTSKASEGDARCIELLSKFKDFDFLSRPEPAEHKVQIDSATTTRIADLAERFLPGTMVNLHRNNAETILELLEKHVPRCIDKTVSMDTLKDAINACEQPKDLKAKTAGTTGNQYMYTRTHESYRFPQARNKLVHNPLSTPCPLVPTP